MIDWAKSHEDEDLYENLYEEITMCLIMIYQRIIWQEQNLDRKSIPYEFPSGFEPPLHMASGIGFAELVTYILQERIYEPIQTQYESCSSACYDFHALHFAAKNGHMEVVVGNFIGYYIQRL